MNAKTLIAAASLVFAASAAMAAEGEQFNPPAPTLTRAGVSALQSAKTEAPTAIVVSSKEATQFKDVPSAQRDRAEVRAEARAAAHDYTLRRSLYIGG